MKIFKITSLTRLFFKDVPPSYRSGDGECDSVLVSHVEGLGGVLCVHTLSGQRSTCVLLGSM